MRWGGVWTQRWRRRRKKQQQKKKQKQGRRGAKGLGGCEGSGLERNRGRGGGVYFNPLRSGYERGQQRGADRLRGFRDFVHFRSLAGGLGFACRTGIGKGGEVEWEDSRCEEDRASWKGAKGLGAVTQEASICCSSSSRRWEEEEEAIYWLCDVSVMWEVEQSAWRWCQCKKRLRSKTCFSDWSWGRSGRQSHMFRSAE